MGDDGSNGRLCEERGNEMDGIGQMIQYSGGCGVLYIVTYLVKRSSKYHYYHEICHSVAA